MLKFQRASIVRLNLKGIRLCYNVIGSHHTKPSANFISIVKLVTMHEKNVVEKVTFLALYAELLALGILPLV